MPRALYDPASPSNTIKRLSSGRGDAFTFLHRYLSSPDSIQVIRPSDRPTKWGLKNLRSDLATWRSALAQVPAPDLFSIPWLGLIADTRSDLTELSNPLKQAVLMENVRLFSTALRDDGLHIGPYQLIANATYEASPLAGMQASLAVVDEAAQREAEANAQADHRFDLELRLNKLRSEEKKLAARSRIPALASEQTLLDLHRVQEEIQSIEQDLQS